MSRVDYCNAIFHDLPDTTLEPLKRVIHTAARVISDSRKFDHITPVLRELHWLPLRQRIQLSRMQHLYATLRVYHRKDCLCSPKNCPTASPGSDPMSGTTDRHTSALPSYPWPASKRA